MNSKSLSVTFSILALLIVQCRAQDTSAKPLQGWLDFLVTDASLPSVVNRIGQADMEKSVDYVAPNAHMYVWDNRFADGTKGNARLELVAVPDNNPLGSRLMVIAIIDPRRPRGIYLPWAWRYVDNVPRGNYIPHLMLEALLN